MRLILLVIAFITSPCLFGQHADSTRVDDSLNAVIMIKYLDSGKQFYIKQLKDLENEDVYNSKHLIELRELMSMEVFVIDSLKSEVAIIKERKKVTGKRKILKELKDRIEEHKMNLNDLRNHQTDMIDSAMHSRSWLVNHTKEMILQLTQQIEELKKKIQ